MSRSLASASSPSGSRERSSRVLRLATLAAGAILAMSVVVTAFAAGAQVSVPAMAAPDAHITVTGTGFGPGQAGNLTYNGGVVTTFAASSAGSFSAPFVVPDWALMGATGRISAKTASGTLIATTTFAVGAKVTEPTLFVPDAVRARKRRSSSRGPASEPPRRASSRSTVSR